MHKIKVLQMIGYGDKTRTQQEITRLFHEKFPNLPPISQGTINKIEKQFREFGHVRQTKIGAANAMRDEIKLDVMLEVEENPHKTIPTQELMEDDFDRRTYFCERMMDMLDNNIVQLEEVMFFDECIFHLTVMLIGTGQRKILTE